mmetsp:Transcript_7395/g.15860  ORF Transcript_7395/g.15860 Transcript_7395/m.15860 type:complete len:142 (+) Transcript_7395:389-814(+)|eukprot:CAMPEP_0168192432 /NCGR_PEP_ID=MMETSP0139_2-20121125/18044_1 /TAXON_ID=44445 /ORGANISM="Pseudo-nitzschia australis, Strain 10249 10 AB" /LENGTH=141 /DNA_ID=CAMNT_0008115669 /DNA_START=244 /DNA_END=669 /DNA_ORIENTATION=-
MEAKPLPQLSTAAAAEEEDAIHDRRKKAFEYTKSVLLGKRIKSTLSDGRTLTGTLICIDRLKNLILTNVIEERLIDPLDYRYRRDGDDNDVDADAQNDNDNEKPIINDGSSRLRKVERHISQAMIPGSRLFKVEIADVVMK